jgi:hypothetical protein
MSYSVKEIFYTLQGEGGQAGMPAVFCRLCPAVHRRNYVLARTMSRQGSNPSYTRLRS